MKPRFGAMTKLAAAAAVGAVLAGGATAMAGQDGANHAKPAHVGHGWNPPNLDKVEQRIENFYGDHVDAEGHHHVSWDSRWASEVQNRISHAEWFLRARYRHVENPAIVLDVDDTSETTYGLTVDNQFAYYPKKSEKAIDDNDFPAIKPTLRLTRWADAHGIKVFFLTGRPEHQKSATLRDLKSQGFPDPAGTFLHPEGDAPGYLHCAPDCTTIQYKSQTRAHIEDVGNTLILNIGDQYSDLRGGHALRPVKLPNPLYYLP
jgi:hypothetical protein